MNRTRERYFEITLLGLILILGTMLLYHAAPFINGILGAVTLYIMLRKVNVALNRRLSDRYTPWVIVLSTTVFVMIPMSFLVWYAIDLVKNVNIDIEATVQYFERILRGIESRTGLDIMSQDTIKYISAKVTGFAQMLMSGINNFALTLFTSLLLLFFLLSGGIRMENYIARLLPFSDGNKKQVISSINTIVRSNALGIPLLALLQGLIAWVGYVFIGVPNAGVMAVLTGFASLIPIVGTMLVWLPLSVALFFTSGLTSALLLAGYGAVIIGSSDNVLRLILQKRMADTHPLITISGVVVGIPVFGFMGLIFGPLLVALFLLFLDMFARQYILGEGEGQETRARRGEAGHKRDRGAERRQNRELRHRRQEESGADGAEDGAQKESGATSAQAGGGAQDAKSHAEATAGQDMSAAGGDAKPARESGKNKDVILAPRQGHRKDQTFKNAKAEHKQQKREAAKMREQMEMEAKNNSRQQDRDQAAGRLFDTVADNYDALRGKMRVQRNGDVGMQESLTGRTMVSRAVSDAMRILDPKAKDEMQTRHEERGGRAAAGIQEDERETRGEIRHDEGREEIYGPVGVAGEDRGADADAFARGSRGRERGGRGRRGRRGGDERRADERRGDDRRSDDRRGGRDEARRSESGSDGGRRGERGRDGSRKSRIRDDARKGHGSRGRRSRSSLDYARLRPEKESRDGDYGLQIIRTVVTGGGGSEIYDGLKPRRSSLQTRLVSVHTARGTMTADPVGRRRSGRRRP